MQRSGDLAWHIYSNCEHNNNIRMIQVHSSFAFMHESLIQLYEMSIVAMVMQIVCYKYAINPT